MTVLLAGGETAPDWLAACRHILERAHPGLDVVLAQADPALDSWGEVWFGEGRPDQSFARGLAVFDLPTPCACLWPGTVPGPDFAALLARLAVDRAVAVGQHGFLALGGPPIGSTRAVAALRERLVESADHGFGLAALIRAAIRVTGAAPLASDGMPAAAWPPTLRWGPAVPVAARDAGQATALDSGGSYVRAGGWIVGASPALADDFARYASMRAVEPPPALVVTLRDVVVHARGVIVTATGQVLRESLINTGEAAAFGPFRREGGSLFMASGGPPPARRIAGPVVLLKQTWDTNYGHWLVESLPRLAMVAECQPIAGLHVIVGAEAGPIGAVYRDTLGLMGIRPEQILALGDEPVAVDELIYPTPITVQPLVKAPRAIRFLEDLGARVPGAPGPGRVFVTRTGGRRVLVNEAAVRARMEAAGFVACDPGLLDFAGQVAMFRNATHVAGHLGAGLTNLVFAPRGVRVLALTSVCMQDDFFWDLVAHKGGSYLSLHGPAADGRTDMQADFTIDLDDLDLCLSIFLDAPLPASPPPALPVIAASDAARRVETDGVLRLACVAALMRRPPPPGPSPIPRTILQFWHDKAAIPDDVGLCLRSWRLAERQGFRRHILGDTEALTFIAAEYGPPELAAYEACHHPAMRCDYLRLAWLLRHGGLYVDADEVFSGADLAAEMGSAELLLQPLCMDMAGPLGMVPPTVFLGAWPQPGWWLYFANAPIMATPGHPVLRIALARATRLIAAAVARGERPDISMTTGPENLTRAVAQHVVTGGQGVATLNRWSAVARPSWDLSYRQDARDWRRNEAMPLSL